MNKAEKFDTQLQELAKFTKVLSHPARLAIIKYLADAGICISGDISDFIPLGRTTVSQHLKELRDLGLIRGEIEGLRINYCLNNSRIREYLVLFDEFFSIMKQDEKEC